VTKAQCISSNTLVPRTDTDGQVNEAGETTMVEALCVNPETCPDNLYANTGLNKCTKYAECRGETPGQYVNFNDNTCLSEAECFTAT
jgi:hypothetical protein